MRRGKFVNKAAEHQRRSAKGSDGAGAAFILKVRHAP